MTLVPDSSGHEYKIFDSVYELESLCKVRRVRGVKHVIIKMGGEMLVGHGRRGKINDESGIRTHAPKDQMMLETPALHRDCADLSLAP